MLLIYHGFLLVDADPFTQLVLQRLIARHNIDDGIDSLRKVLCMKLKVWNKVKGVDLIVCIELADGA